MHQYGNAEIKFHLNEKLIINTSIIQACILLSFNVQRTWTYYDLKEKFKDIKPEVLQRHLKLLVYGKGAIIKKGKANLVYEDEETLKLNEKYTSNAIRVNLVPAGAPKKPATVQDENAENSGIMKERGQII
jgi:hypothetical protein